MKRVAVLIAILPILIFANGHIDELIKSGKAGDKRALYQLGFMYENGMKVDIDLEKAKRYYRQAVELGSEDAKLSLSLMDLSNKLDKRKVSLSNSVTVKGSQSLDYELSVSDLKDVLSRAKKSDKDALFTLATIYDNGYGDIKADRVRAIALYKKAATLGSKQAKNVLLVIDK